MDPKDRQSDRERELGRYETTHGRQVLMSRSRACAEQGLGCHRDDFGRRQPESNTGQPIRTAFATMSAPDRYAISGANRTAVDGGKGKPPGEVCALSVSI